MKRLTYLLLLSVLLLSCGGSRGQFKIEGRFLHINGGRLFVYSPDGVIDGMDTVQIQDGRFALEVPCRNEGTLVFVFPNYSQQVVFAESGGKVEVKADATHLKEMDVKGTKANELMTKFRHAVASMSPPEEARFASQFVQDHPESPVAVYLTRKYFVENGKPDLKQAEKLIAVMSKTQKDKGSLVRLRQQVDIISRSAVGHVLPKFTATDVNGRKVTNAYLNAPTAVISVWATWNYESLDAQRALAGAIEKSDGKLKVVSICVDASKADCMRSMKNNNIDWPVVCDGMMLDSKLMAQLGLSTIPDNIILKNGRVVESGLNTATLRQRMQEMYH